MDQLNYLLGVAEPYLNQAFLYGHTFQRAAASEIVRYWPQAAFLNRFEIFLVVNLLIIALFIVERILKALNPVSLYHKIVRFSFGLPFVKAKMNSELDKAKGQFMKDYPAKHRSQLKKIPYNVVQPKFGNESELQSVKGHLSGSRYPDKKHSDFVVSLAKEYSYSNPLHFDLHPYLKQMEVQVLKMCAKMINFYSAKEEAVGGFFSGGTESILMAILAYREHGYKYKGIRNPNLVICTTGHAAALKACDMFGIDVRFVNPDRNYQMSISDMKSKIDGDTVCVYTSYPNYPYGTVDPIEQIAAICSRKKVPVHVDMCLGGFLVPFLTKKDGTPFFKVPAGVTSISMDCHKYGLSAKGASVLLFSSEDYRKEQLFVTSEWPGGLYGTIGIAGSRTGSTIASAWVSMMRMGIKGYTKNANTVRDAVLKLATELRQLGFKVFGQPEICCIGFSHPTYPVGVVKDALKKKGWDFPIIQKPLALHYSFTPINSLRVDQIVASFKQILPELEKLKKQNKIAKGSELELYGICAKIPDVGAKDIIMKNVLDMFLEI